MYAHGGAVAAVLDDLGAIVQPHIPLDVTVKTAPPRCCSQMRLASNFDKTPNSN